MTELFPMCEVELTAALACLMASETNETKLIWKKCESLRDGESLADFLDVLEQRERVVLTEHPLFANDNEDIQNWGGMRADAIIS